MANKSRRVVVTGLGAVTALAHNAPDSFDRLCRGVSGVSPITRFDPSNLPVRFAATIPEGFDPAQFFPAPDVRRLCDPFLWYAVVAGREALEDSKLTVTEKNSPRVGVLIGSGIGGIGTIEKNHTILNEQGVRRISPFFVSASILNTPAGYLSQQCKLRGPNIAMGTACATGSHAIAVGARLIAAGDCDAVLAGGAECPISPLSVAGFAASRALSQRNDEPEKASRPWDKQRDGFVLGEGAGVVFLEEYEHAANRGAHIYGELGGVGMSADAWHLTAPPEDGAGAKLAMTAAIRDAGLAPEAVGHINAHSTSTPLGDRSETLAIKSLFGGHAPKIAISANKSMIGHALGAAGGIEAVVTLLSMEKGIVPPTINLDEPDEDCDLDYVPHKAKKLAINAAMSNSFGFGGTNVALLFTAPPT